MRLLEAVPKRQTILISATGCLLGLVLAACTSSPATPAAAPVAAPTSTAAKPAVASPSPAANAASPVASPAATPAGPAVVKVTQNPSLGAILTDAAGRTLYMFTNDKDKTSACYDQCERTWPPLLTRGQPQAGEGAATAKLSTTARRDGSMQVVYDEYPLYYYTPDTAPGDTKGQRVGNVWFVLGASGEPIK